MALEFEKGKTGDQGIICKDKVFDWEGVIHFTNS